jgi:hypothetical protein
MTVNKLLAAIIIASIWSLSFSSPAYKADCRSSDIERIDSCLMGLPLKEAISNLKVDSSQFLAFDEPPGILRGIRIDLADTCMIRLYVERTSIVDKLDSFDNWRMDYLHIIDKKVIGVTWKKLKQKKGKAIGYRIGYWHDLER